MLSTNFLFTALLLASCVFGHVHASLRGNNDANAFASSDERVLQDEDDAFWFRIVQEEAGSSLTDAPTTSPTKAPTEAPTPEPTVPPPCILDFSIDCPGCDPGVTKVEQCTDRPLEIGMLYAGGDCSLSAQCQDGGKFTCQDFSGGPPTTFGEKSYIVATDKDEDQVYYRGWVSVGSSYIMDNNFERFPADQKIKIYSSDVTTQENLLQDVQYHSSCSQNLDLLNRFGSNVIVSWYNEEQGNITGFDSVDLGIDLRIPIDAGQFAGDGTTVTGLAVIQSTTSQNGDPDFPSKFYDLSKVVAGTNLTAGESLEVNLPITLNLALELDYEFLITMTASGTTGQNCTGTKLLSFTVGGSPSKIGIGSGCPEL